MKNSKVFLIALMCFFGISEMFAQNISGYVPGAPLPCRADEHIHQFFQNNPEALERFIQPRKSRKTAERPDSYVIPVVFHVFGEKFNGSSLNDEIIIDALNKTNEDFQGITANTGDDNPDFDRLKQKMNITFKLAEKDPNGAATTGITYHRLESGFGNYYAPNMALYAWDNKKYMNIYIMNDLYGDGETNNSGVSWYPDVEMVEENIARVVYNGAYIGTNTDENFRRVLTHEFGHFFNLAHTFDTPDGFKNGCTPNGSIPNPGDYVDDTPPADEMSFGAADRNCEGNLTNWTNYMNYSYVRTSMYTKGQVDRMLDALEHASRVSLWSADTHNKVFFEDATTKRIALTSRGDILEASANDGSFAGTFEFAVINGTLANKTFSEADFTTENLPVGLTVKLTRINDTKLKLSFEGKAENNDSDAKFTITFKSSMLASGTLYDCKLPLTLIARAAYGIKYVNCEDVNISSAFSWKFVQLDDRYENSDFGLMYNPNADNYKGNLYVESYGKQMMGTGTNLSVVNYGDKIGSSSRWTTNITEYPKLGTLVSKGYAAWKGQLAFVGIQFQGTLPGETLYGWMRVSVAEDGKSFTLLDYAFNEQPGAEIVAGQKGSVITGAEVLFGTTSVTEDTEANDGTIKQTVNIAVMGDNTFNKIGELVAGTDYTSGKIPAGLTAHIKVVSDKKAMLSFEGKAINHEAKDLDVVEFALKPSLFTNPGMTNLSFQLNFNFLNLYKIIKGTLGVSAGRGYEAWTNFKVPGVMEYTNGYGAWEYASKHLKIETYGKPMVGLTGTRNIAFLEKDTEIGAGSTWVFPVGSENYPQLDLATSKFKDWYGKTGYAGISFPYLGSTLYGWFEITVATDGSYYTINSFGYNQKPGASILAGEGDEDVTGIQELELDGIAVSPNPVSDELNVIAPEDTRIVVYNIAGIMVWNGSTATNQMVIPVSDWAKGIYFLHLSKDERNAVRKIMVK